MSMRFPAAAAVVLAAMSAAFTVMAQPASKGAAPFTATEIKAAGALRDRAMRGTGAFDIVASLTTEIGPRPAGSPADRAAVAWALAKLNELGFQNVRAQNVEVPQWVRGSIEASIVSPWPQPLVAAALGGSVGTGEDGVKAEVLPVESIDALKKLSRDQVAGKIVFINRRMERARDGAGYGVAVPARTEGAMAAASLGAAAVVIRSIGTDVSRAPHTGTVRYSPDIPRIPAAALSVADANMLERQIASGKTVTLKLKIGSRDLPPVNSANVIGEIVGSDPSLPVVLLGAHLDSWDLGTGAIDDGAGVAIVVEAARLVREMKLKPKRTIRVVLFANEEFGLSGAKVYAASEKPERHMVAYEADFGGGPVYRFDTAVAEAALPATEYLMNALKPIGVERGSTDARCGADVTPLKKLGVPVFDLQQDGSDYFDYHHTPEDTLDKIDAKKLDQAVAAFAVVAYMSAAMNGDYGRLPIAK